MSEKIKMAIFTVPEYEKEQEWLRKQHLAGWKLTRVSGLCFYHFEKCEPEEVVYQLDYNKEGLDHKNEYVQMFQDCGWEHITDLVGYSYFRKPAAQMNKEEKIFCDDASQMDMIRRVFKGKMIPLLIIFFSCIVPQLFLQYSLRHSFHHVLFEVNALLFILYLVIFVKFSIQYYKLIKKPCNHANN